MAKLKKLAIPSVDSEVEQLEHLCINGGNTKLYSHFGKIWQLLIKLSIDLPYNHANNATLRYLPERNENVCSHIN